MKYDDLVGYLGEIGPYQIYLYVLVCLPTIPTAIQTLISVFMLGVPTFRCAVPGYKNDTFKTHDKSHQQLINYTLPWTYHKDSMIDESSAWGDAECHVFSGRTHDSFSNFTGPIMGSGMGYDECKEWVYSTDVFERTFVTDIDLVCDKRDRRAHANMIYMCGFLFGSLFYGLISDRFGRKRAFLIALLFQCSSSIAIAFADSFVAFAILRFVTAANSIGVGICTFVLAMELLGKQYRAQAGACIQLFWCVGMFILNIAAYAERDWQKLQLIMSCPFILFFSLYWLAPESPRWQISKGKIDQAKVTLEKMAKANGKELPKDAFDDDDQDQPAQQGSIVDVFTSPTLLFRVFVVFFNWLVVTLVYYGLTLNVANLGGDIYQTFAFSGIVETFGNFATIFALPRFGRKSFHCFSMILGGAACLASMIPVLVDAKVGPWVNIMLSNIGKFGATGGFSTIYVFTAELFPTFMRNSIIGSSSMVARIGGIAAPYIAELGVLVGGKFGTALPFMVFGGASVLAGCLALTLPETLGANTPETIEDAINFGRNKSDESSEKYTPKLDKGVEIINVAFEKE